MKEICCWNNGGNKTIETDAEKRRWQIGQSKKTTIMAIAHNGKCSIVKNLDPPCQLCDICICQTENLGWGKHSISLQNIEYCSLSWWKCLSSLLEFERVERISKKSRKRRWLKLDEHLLSRSCHRTPCVPVGTLQQWLFIFWAYPYPTMRVGLKNKFSEC